MFDFMHTPRLHAVLLMLALSPASALAMLCSVQGSGERVLHGELGSTLAIPESLPDGEVVWRSGRQNVRVECTHDGQPGPARDVFIQLDPEQRGVGQGIRAGLSLDGAEHFSGRLPTGQVLPACSDAQATASACPVVRFNLGFSVFIQKYGATPPSGVPGMQADYRVFRLGAESDSLSYVLDHLAGLRFIACDAQLQVSPETLAFGEMAIHQVEVGKVFERRAFSLSTRRTCDSPFSLDARFRPVTGSLAEGLLIPAGNPSLGIRIVRAANSEILRYNEPFHLTDLLGDTRINSVDFNAELLWQSNRPVPGPFQAEVMIDLYYK